MTIDVVEGSSQVAMGMVEGAWMPSKGSGCQVVVEGVKQQRYMLEGSQQWMVVMAEVEGAQWWWTGSSGVRCTHFLSLQIPPNIGRELKLREEVFWCPSYPSHPFQNFEPNKKLDKTPSFSLRYPPAKQTPCKLKWYFSIMSCTQNINPFHPPFLNPMIYISLYFPRHFV